MYVSTKLFFRNSLTFLVFARSVMPDHRHEQFSVSGTKYVHPKVWGRRGEAVLQVKPCYKGPRFNSVRTSWTCAGAYAAATHPYPTGASASLLSSFLRPNQARVARDRQAPGRAASASQSLGSAPGSREEGYNKWKKEIQSQQQISTNQVTAN